MSVASFLKIVIGCETTTTNTHTTYNTTHGALERPGRGEQIPFILLFSLLMAAALCFVVKMSLRAIGFGADGIKPASLAAHIQNWLHPMPEDSIFVRLQHLGAHGISWRDQFLVAEFIYSILVSIFF
ncbi:uncharacterized protein LOC142579485 [Dermacentor variabilis]|uniref:uncharacterized protein LOC142577846 n=1 Tax=Dermacentor variabilis TaxID=34621 RepID=UPI003F5BF96B